MEKDITSLLAIEAYIQSNTIIIKGHKIILDFKLADLHGVELVTLHRQVNRNKARFPNDFMFRLTKEEWKALNLKNRRRVYAFTEAGIMMAGGVLHSERAIKTHMQMIEYFVGNLKYYDLDLVADGVAKDIFQLILKLQSRL